MLASAGDLAIISNVRDWARCSPWVAMASGPCQDIPGGIVSTGISALITCAGNSRTMPQAATALANNLTSAGALASRTGERGPISVRRSEEHTSELQSLMRISYAVFCLKKKKKDK